MMKLPAVNSSLNFLTACLLSVSGIAVVLLFFSRGTSDMDVYWLKWLELARSLGPVDAYAAADSDYPPLTMAILWLGERILSSVTTDAIIQIKLLLLFALAAGTGLYWYLSRHALLTAVFLASQVIGAIGLAYLDIFAGLWILAAALLLMRGHSEGFVILFACAMLTKWQPLIMAPVVALYLLRVKNIRQITPLLIWLTVFLGVVYLFDTEQVLAAWLKLQQAINGSNFNACALGLQGMLDSLAKICAMFSTILLNDEIQIQNFYQTVDNFTLINTGILSSARLWISNIFFTSFFICTLWGFIRGDRKIDDLLRCSVQVYVIYFIFRHGVHENHLYLPALLALILAARQRAYLRDAVILNLLHYLNIIYL